MRKATENIYIEIEHHAFKGLSEKTETFPSSTMKT